MSVSITNTDFLVVGSGIAGLATALKARERGRVTLLTKGTLLDSNTVRAQGGIAAAVGEGDSPYEHLQDTLRAGHQLSQPDAASVLVEEGPKRIQELIDLGARFDADPSGRLALGREAAHSRNRILHARGDATGAEVAEVLGSQVLKDEGIHVLQHHFVLDLIVSQGRCVGVSAVDRDGVIHHLVARAVILATGGCGRVYQYTTNPHVATGDGFAIAARHRVTLMDMEFIQFHPTALAKADDPMVLVSEAVRGEGARLINEDGVTFMDAIHPGGDLAPRDIVARGIFQQMAQGQQVFLDARPIGERFPSRFPTIYSACIERGIDPLTQPIPIAPAAHFIMGGIRTDTYGRTSMPGLYACGEVACTGVHGANRLASNSLLEGLVFAERVARSLDEDNPPDVPQTLPPDHIERLEKEFGLECHGSKLVGVDVTPDFPKLLAKLRQVMWDYAGIVRSQPGLLRALDALEHIEREAPPAAWTLRNLIITGRLITQSALERQESRGGHYREDFPTERAEWLEKRVTI